MTICTSDGLITSLLEKSVVVVVTYQAVGSKDLLEYLIVWSVDITTYDFVQSNV